MTTKPGRPFRRFGALALALAILFGLYAVLARVAPDRVPTPSWLTSGLAEVRPPTYPLPDSFWRGMLAAESGQWKRAIEEFRISLVAAPEAPPVYLAMGTAQGELGQNLLAAVHLKAYVELWPDSPNADRIHARIMRLTEPYRQIANVLFEDATKLSLLTPDADWSRTYYELTSAGADARVREFIKVLPKGASKGIAESYMINKKFGAHMGGSEHALLRDAIAAEARYFAKDIVKTGCVRIIAAPDAVCPTPSELFAKPPEAIEQARQCWASNGKFASSNPTPVGSDAIAAAISYHTAVLFKVSNLRLGEINRLLLQDYDRLRHAGAYQCDAFFAPPPGLSIVAQGKGLAAITPTGWLDFNAFEDAAPSRPYAMPSAARAVREGRFSSEYAKLTGWEISLNDAVFGDFPTAVDAIAQLPAAERAAAMWRTGAKLIHLVAYLQYR